MRILRIALLIPWALALAAPAEPASPARAHLSKRERIALCEKKIGVPLAPGDPKPLKLPDPKIKRPVLIRKVAFLEGKELDNRLLGFVFLESVIDEDGCVRQVKVIRGAGTPLAAAVLKAVPRWVFEPATRDGRPVRVKYLLTVNLE